MIDLNKIEMSLDGWEYEDYTSKEWNAFYEGVISALYRVYPEQGKEITAFFRTKCSIRVSNLTGVLK
jgi:hypothetical protein